MAKIPTVPARSALATVALFIGSGSLGALANEGPRAIRAIAAGAPISAGAAGASAAKEGAKDAATGAYTLLSPSPRWRVLDEDELKAVDAHAFAGLAGPGSSVSLLSAERTNRVNLRELVEETFRKQHLDLTNALSIEDSLFEGRKAATGLVTGKREGEWWRCWTLVFRDAEYVYRLSAWGRSAEVPADGSTLSESALGLKFVAGARPEALGRGKRAPDAEGAGWRLRDGVYRDSALGFVLAPQGPWRLTRGSELATLGSKFRVGLIDDKSGALLGVAAERVGNGESAAYLEECQQHWAHVGYATGTLQANLGRLPLLFRIQSVAAFSGDPGAATLMPCAALCEAGRGVQVVGRFPIAEKARLQAMLQQALGGLSLLSDADRDSLRREFGAAAPQRREFVGEGWRLTGGELVEYRLGLRFLLPAGNWSAEAADGKVDEQGRRLLVSLEEPAQGLSGRLWLVEEASAADAARLAKVAARCWPDVPLEPQGQAAPLEMGDVQGLCADYRGKPLLRTRAYWLAAAGRDDLLAALAVEGPQELVASARAELLGLAGAIHVAASPVPPTLQSAGQYQDLRLRFELASPETNWSFGERKFDRLSFSTTPCQGVAVGFKGSGGRRLAATAAWCSDLTQVPAGEVQQWLPNAFLGMAPLPARAPDKDSAVTFRGRSARLLEWEDGASAVALLVLVRDATLYAAAAFSAPGDAPPRDALAAFRLLE